MTVLHQGKVLSHGTVAEVQADPKVQEVYLGTAGAATTAAMLVVPDATTAADGCRDAGGGSLTCSSSTTSRPATGARSCCTA